jgi:preprotein translocase subunit SecA
LAEWQREGFDMFEAMMESIKDDFVRYIFRLEVVADDAPRPARNLRYSASEDPVQGSGGFSAAAAAGPIEELGGEAPVVVEAPAMEPVRKEKTPDATSPATAGAARVQACHGR